MNRAKLVNTHTKQWTYTKLGLSWTNFFFGSWVPLYRGEGGQFWIYTLFCMLTFGIYPLVMVFKFNKGYVQRKLQNGWRPITKTDKEILLSYGILSPESMEEMGEDTEFTIPYVPNKTGFYILLVLSILFVILCGIGLASMETYY